MSFIGAFAFGESFGFVASIVLGLTFLLSGLSKLPDLRGFVLGVLDYEVLPRPLAITYGRSLPFVELACGVALLAGVWPVITSAIATIVLVSFVVAVAINIGRKRQMDCHCFGSHAAEPLGWITLIRLSLLTALAMIVASSRDNRLLALPPPDFLPLMLTATGGLLILYMLGAAPSLWQVWRMSSAPAPTLHGGRVSLRNQPLEPLALLLTNRSHETSGCANCLSRESAASSRGSFWN